jgi:hypothetical protein
MKKGINEAKQKIKIDKDKFLFELEKRCTESKQKIERKQDEFRKRDLKFSQKPILRQNKTIKVEKENF